MSKRPLNLPVFPCSQDKKPLTTNGFKDATADPEKIKAWERAHPGCLWGVPTGAASGILVVDCDGSNGAAWYKENKGKLGTPRGHKTRKGAHLLYANDESVRCSTSKVAPNVDVRAEGGYIIWWSDDPTLNAKTLTPAPAWLIAAMNGTTASSDFNYDEAIKGVCEGSRDDTGYKLACKWRGEGDDEPTILAKLRDWNKRNRPWLPDRDIQRIAKQGAKFEPNSRPATLADFQPVVVEKRKSCSSRWLSSSAPRLCPTSSKAWSSKASRSG